MKNLSILLCLLTLWLVQVASSEEGLALLREDSAILVYQMNASKETEQLAIIDLQVPKGMKYDVVPHLEAIALWRVSGEPFSLNMCFMHTKAIAIFLTPFKQDGAIAWHWVVVDEKGVYSTNESVFEDLNELTHDLMLPEYITACRQNKQGKNQFGQTLYEATEGRSRQSNIFLNSSSKEFVPGAVWHYSTTLEKLEGSKLYLLEPADACYMGHNEEEKKTLEGKLQRWELTLDHKARKYSAVKVGEPFKK